MQGGRVAGGFGFSEKIDGTGDIRNFVQAGDRRRVALVQIRDSNFGFLDKGFGH